MRASDPGNLLRHKISAPALKLLLLLFLRPFVSAIWARQPGSAGLGDRLYPELGSGGDDGLFEVLRTFYAEFAYSVARAEDFIALPALAE